MSKCFDRKKATTIFALPTEITQGSVVQLVRMPPCHGGGRGFESRPVRKKGSSVMMVLFAFCPTFDELVIFNIG